MLKKAVFVAAILLITGGAYAAKPGNIDDHMTWQEWDGNANLKGEVWNWPAEYKYMPICAIPVKMDVGFWIRVIGCKDLVLKLKQVDIRHYAGTLNDVQVQCNIGIDLALDFSLVSGFPGAVDYKTVSPSHLDAPGGTVNISAGIKDVDLSKLDPTNDCVDVGTLTLKVRPSVSPTEYMGGC